MIVRRITDEQEIKSALRLALDVFMRFEAPEYPEEGIESFKASLSSKEYLEKLKIYGAFEGSKLVGTIATRLLGSHIALFFVDEEYQGRGIGRLLFDEVLQNCHTERLTVNSSPYAAKIYRHFGFKDDTPEQTADGIRYIPMTYTNK
ncbi:MAG: GNAT family N-acetyltransferase [Ruminiclostridium sp.]